MKKLNKTLIAAGLAMTVPTVSAQVLEEIIVTAQKRSESLQDFAGSISAFTESQIDDRGFTTVESIYQSVPGLNYSDTFGVNMISIRGIGMQVETGFAEPGVATHVDGVFQPRASMSSMRLVDMERVEVLRGPQGTLYGRNATGGVVNFISRKPTEEFEAEATLGAGDWDMIKANGYISGSLGTDKLLGRLSGSYYDHDGYIKNLAGGDDLGTSKQQDVRAALRWLPSDSVIVDLSASYQEEDYHNITQAVDIDLQAGFLDLLGAYADPDAIGLSDAPWTAHQVAPYPEGEKETTRFILNVDWEINDRLSFVSLTGYNDHTQGPELYAVDQSSGQALVIGLPGYEKELASESFSQEFNLKGVSFDDRLDWVVGLYYFEEDLDLDQPGVFSAPLDFVLGAAAYGAAVRYEVNEQIATDNTQSAAIFADVSYSITDSLHLNLGIRYSEDEKDVVQRNADLLSNPLPIPQTVAGVVIPAGETARISQCDGVSSGNQSLDWDATSPKVRLEWNASEEVMVYGQWQEGYKAGGVNYSTCDDVFEPEELTAWEVGVKSTLLDGAMILNAAAYTYYYDDLQVFNLDETGAAAFIQNVEESEIKGAEVEWQWQLSEAVSLDSGVSYIDSEISKSIDLVDTFTLIENAKVGINDTSQAFLSPNGNSIPRSPEWSGQVGVNLDFSTDLGDFTVRGEIYYQDETQYRVFGLDEDLADSYTVGNLFATYTTPSGNLTFRGTVRNVTDEEYLVQRLHTATMGFSGVYGPPRHWSVEMTYRFN